MKAHETVELSGVEVSDEGRKVFLKIPQIKPVMQMKIRMKAEAADKSQVVREIYLTLHNLGS